MRRFLLPLGRLGGAYFLYFCEGEARIFGCSQASAYQGNRLRPSAWMTVGSLLTNRHTGSWAIEP